MNLQRSLRPLKHADTSETTFNRHELLSQTFKFMAKREDYGADY